jgi:hypothetical protein
MRHRERQEERQADEPAHVCNSTARVAGAADAGSVTERFVVYAE